MQQLPACKSTRAEAAMGSFTATHKKQRQDAKAHCFSPDSPLFPWLPLPGPDLGQQKQLACRPFSDLSVHGHKSGLTVSSTQHCHNAASAAGQFSWRCPAAALRRLGRREQAQMQVAAIPIGKQHSLGFNGNSPPFWVHCTVGLRHEVAELLGAAHKMCCRHLPDGRVQM